MSDSFDVSKFCDYLEEIGFLISSFPKQEFL